MLVPSPDDVFGFTRQTSPDYSRLANVDLDIELFGFFLATGKSSSPISFFENESQMRTPVDQHYVLPS